MSKHTWWKKLREEFSGNKETEFLPAILEVTETPPSPVGRLVMWTMVILLVSGVLWSVFGHVDEVAVANGKIVPVGQVKVIQVEDKGIVKNIYVQDGQEVKAGDVLLELDETVTEADLARTRKQIAYYNLEIERLTAEMMNTPFVPTMAPDLDPKDLQFQTKLYQSRQAEYQSKVVAAQMQVQQSGASLESGKANLQKYAEQLQIAREREGRLEQLASQNAIAYFQVLEERSRRIELAQNVDAQQAELLRIQATMAENQQKVANAAAEYNKEIMTALVEDRKQLSAYTEELKKASEKNRLAKITAPVSGHVHALSVHTIGGIVTAAQPIMMIVPDDTKLEIEAWAENRDIGFIQLGQKAEVKVSTFNFQKFGVVEAEVEEISPDATESSNDKEKSKKYRIVLQFDQQDVSVGERKAPLSPGMEVSAEIKIRQKRIYEFFLDPFRKYQSESLRER